jgi:hypothetical protein
LRPGPPARLGVIDVTVAGMKTRHHSWLMAHRP